MWRSTRVAPCILFRVDLFLPFRLLGCHFGKSIYRNTLPFSFLNRGFVWIGIGASASTIGKEPSLCFPSSRFKTGPIFFSIRRKSTSPFLVLVQPSRVHT